MHSGTGLRYRGKDLNIRKKFNEKSNQSEVCYKPASLERVGTSQAFFKEERFNTPPKDVKVSYAYGVAPSLWDTVSKRLPQISITTLFKMAMTLSQQTSATLKSLYNAATPDEKTFVDTISSQMNNYYISRGVQSVFGLNPLIYSIVLMSYRMTVEATQLSTNSSASSSSGINDTPSFRFFNGFPSNGTNLCADTSTSTCEQFYVTLDNKTVAQGASSITSTWQPINVTIPVVTPCGSIQTLQAFLQQHFNTQQAAALSNQTCITENYSYGRTIHLDSKLTGVTDSVCTTLRDNSINTVTPCVQRAVYNAFDASQDNNTFNPNQGSGTNTTLIVLLPMFLFAIISVANFCIITRSRLEEDETIPPAARSRNRIFPAVAPQQAIELANLQPTAASDAQTVAIGASMPPASVTHAEPVATTGAATQIQVVVQQPVDSKNTSNVSSGICP